MQKIIGKAIMANRSKFLIGNIGNGHYFVVAPGFKFLSKL